MPLNVKEAAARISSSRRPVLTHLNADTTWLLSIPIPSHGTDSADSTTNTNRSRFNILIDPWLRGPQIDQAGWFSRQWHAIESSVQHVSEIEELLQQVEEVQNSDALATAAAAAAAPSSPSSSSMIDAVIISHEFTDHCHKNTLKEVHASVPVYATAKAAKIIQSWSHFDTVLEIPSFTENKDWRKTSYAPLPSWLGISRLINEDDLLYYHSAVIICTETAPATAEAIIYTPHGVEAESFSALASADPPVKVLAFLHGLHDVALRFTAQLNLGAHNALKAQRMLKAPYWVGTHDEVKKGRGMVAAWLRRKPYTVQDALTHEAANLKRAGDEKPLTADISFFELSNGEQLILE